MKGEGRGLALAGEAGFAALAAAAGGPLPAAVATLMGPVVERAAEELQARRADRVLRVLHEAARQAEQQTGALVETLLADEAAAELLAAVMVAAQTIVDERHQRALARCLARAAQDGSRVDQERPLARTLGALQEPDVRALLAASTADQAFPEGTPLDETHWDEAAVVARDPGLRGIAGALLAHLESLGLVRPHGAVLGPANAWYLSPWGWTVLGALRDEDHGQD